MKSNYLNNKDILKEIHKSKTTYCSFSDPSYANYDLIVHNIKQINKKNIKAARQNRADRLSRLAHEAAQAQSTEKLKPELELHISKESEDGLVKDKEHDGEQSTT